MAQAPGRRHQGQRQLPVQPGWPTPFLCDTGADILPDHTTECPGHRRRVNNVGFVLRRDAEARLTYAPLVFFNATLFATYSRNEFLEDVNTGTIEGGGDR